MAQDHRCEVPPARVQISITAEETKVQMDALVRQRLSVESKVEELQGREQQLESRYQALQVRQGLFEARK